VAASQEYVNTYSTRRIRTSVLCFLSQVARRLFAFAREVAGYNTLVEGPGQEPVNAVYYKVRLYIYNI